MVNQELLNYINQTRSLGLDDPTINQQLLDNGWEKSSIDQVFKQLDNKQSQLHPTTLPVSNHLFDGPIELLKNSWSIFTQQTKSYFLIALFPMGLSSIITFLQKHFYEQIIEAGFPDTPPFIHLYSIMDSQWYLFLAIAFIISIFNYILRTIAFLALAKAVKDYPSIINVSHTYHYAFQKFFRYWWTMILAGAITAGGLILFVIPGLLFAIWFMLTAYVVVAEDLYGIPALLKSKHYVRGNLLGIIGRQLIFSLIVLLPASAVPGIIGLLKPFIDSAEIISSITLGISTIIITPISIIFSYLLFTNLQQITTNPAPSVSQNQKLKYYLLGVFGVIAGVILFIKVYYSIFDIFANPNLSYNETGIREQQSQTNEQKARDNIRRADQQRIQSALERYWATNGHYPDTLDQLVQTAELKKVPVDPSTKLPYQYQVLENGNNFQLCYQDENEQKQCQSADPLFREYNYPTPSLQPGKIYRFNQEIPSDNLESIRDLQPQPSLKDTQRESDSK